MDSKENKKIKDIIDALEESSSEFPHTNILVSTLGEYMDSFILTGFDHSGNRITTAGIKAERDIDALARQIYRTNRMFESDFEKEFVEDEN